MTEHTKTPYKVHENYDWIIGSDENIIANCTGHHQQKSNAAFIVKACNNHEALKSTLTDLWKTIKFNHLDDSIVGTLFRDRVEQLLSELDKEE